MHLLIPLLLMIPVAGLPGKATVPLADDAALVRQMLADASPFTGVVTPAAAAILLPVPEREVWEWHLPDTPEDMAEYLWEVVIHNQNQTYRLAFGLWKFPGDSYTEGDIEHLLYEGQSDLWYENPENGHNEVVSQVRVRTEPHKPGQILLMVEGRETIDRLFSSRPGRLESHLLSPYETREGTVHMMYPEIDEH